MFCYLHSTLWLKADWKADQMSWYFLGWLRFFQVIKFDWIIPLHFDWRCFRLGFILSFSKGCILFVPCAMPEAGSILLLSSFLFHFLSFTLFLSFVHLFISFFCHFLSLLPSLPLSFLLFSLFFFSLSIM